MCGSIFQGSEQYSWKFFFISLIILLMSFILFGGRCKLGECRILLCEPGVKHKLQKLQLNFPRSVCYVNSNLITEFSLSTKMLL